MNTFFVQDMAFKLLLLINENRPMRVYFILYAYEILYARKRLTITRRTRRHRHHSSGIMNG